MVLDWWDRSKGEIDLRKNFVEDIGNNTANTTSTIKIHWQLIKIYHSIY